MNLLFLANRLPYPPHRGDKLKIFNLAKQLNKRHNLYLLTFVQNKNDFKYIDELEKYFKIIRTVYLPKFKSAMNCVSHILTNNPFQINYFYSPEFKKMLYDFLEKHNIDAIHTQHLRMSQYSYDIKHVKTILDLPDAYSLYWKRRAELNNNLLCKKFNQTEYTRVLKYESILKNFDLNLVCSEEDKNYLIDNHKIEKIDILPNGIDLDTFKSDQHDYDIDRKLIFSGNMSYFPNVDAACFFASEIFPIIQKNFPDVKLYISGQNPSSKVLKLRSNNIIVTGFVNSIEKVYRESTIAISPVRVGAGTLNKVLEPMAMGLPVVSSSVGFKGLGAKTGEHIFNADEPLKFADAVMSLLSDKYLRKSVGEAGKKLVTENFSWEKISNTLEQYIYRMFNYPYAV